MTMNHNQSHVLSNLLTKKCQWVTENICYTSQVSVVFSECLYHVETSLEYNLACKNIDLRSYITFGPFFLSYKIWMIGLGPCYFKTKYFFFKSIKFKFNCNQAKCNFSRIFSQIWKPEIKGSV